MILLWGLLQDDTFRCVHDCLQRRGAKIALVNHADLGRTHVEYQSAPDPAYRLRCGGDTYELNDMSAAYLRPYDHRLYNDVKQREREVSQPDVVHHLLMSWAEHTAATVVNRPSAEATNQSKLFQAMAIRQCGFKVPESLVSNDAEEIERFAVVHERVIYKSMSSVRSVVEELNVQSLRALGAMGPALFQQRIAGRNVRVHVVGDETVACAIESDATDYRYGKARMTPYALTDEVASQCVNVTRRFGMVLSGIDLIATADGEYYCLEVNPSPAFSVFQTASARSIADLVADRLMATQTMKSLR